MKTRVYCDIIRSLLLDHDKVELSLCNKILQWTSKENLRLVEVDWSEYSQLENVTGFLLLERCQLAAFEEYAVSFSSELLEVQYDADSQSLTLNNFFNWSIDVETPCEPLRAISSFIFKSIYMTAGMICCFRPNLIEVNKGEVHVRNKSREQNAIEVGFSLMFKRGSNVEETQMSVLPHDYNWNIQFNPYFVWDWCRSLPEKALIQISFCRDGPLRLQYENNYRCYISPIE